MRARVVRANRRQFQAVLEDLKGRKRAGSHRAVRAGGGAEAKGSKRSQIAAIAGVFEDFGVGIMGIGQRNVWQGNDE